MFNSLFAKLTLVLILLFILLGSLTISITFFATDLYQQEIMQKLNGSVATHIVRKTDILQDDKINHKALRQLFSSVMMLNPNLEIYLLDEEGGILDFSAPPWKVVRMSVDLAPIKQFLAGETGKMGVPIRGEDPRYYEENKVFSAAVVTYKNKPRGYLYVIIGGEQYDSIVEKIKGSYILTSSLIVIAVGLFIAFFVSILLFAILTKRLKNLANTVSKFEDNPQRAPVFPHFKQKGDEIDRLAAAFQTMAVKIHHQLDDLQTTDTLRRELVANVSHDLRTPLATLQGYIETLLIKEADLTAKERRSYLQTAIKHCLRLNKLVAELFELARLDASETTPQQEVFNLAELTEDIIQKFALQSEKNNIQLTSEYTSTELFVSADISLIERVLENLLENALRFVPEGGKITLALSDIEQKVYIKIIDNGAGIPETEIPYIFDRFYQLDKNRCVESNHAGLGLAIVKKIIELHNSVINVTSIPTQETTFSFYLPTVLK